MKTISVKDKDFELYISEQEINQIVCQLAKNISEDLKEENLLILAVLNGSFIFVADLVSGFNKSYNGQKQYVLLFSLMQEIDSFKSFPPSPVPCVNVRTRPICTVFEEESFSKALK